MSKDPIYSIADFNSVRNRVEDLKYRSEDVKSRLAITLKKLWNTERSLRTVPEDLNLITLSARFPQFDEVIDFYENTIISLARLNLPFEIPPILLQGDPGLGKTFFASELAKLINLPFFEISLATATSSFALSGSTIQWSEGTTGFISETLASSAVANPMILIDEVDKASADAKYNPLNVFYGLLEPHSARRFRDEALEIELDASKIIWIATGNYIRKIPAPIQSRMRVFHIKQPEPEKMFSVITSIYDHVIRTKVYGKLLDTELDEAVIIQLANQSPRAVRLAIEEGAFKAIRNQRSAIIASDLPMLLKKENYRVGFI
jgi:ATP-dependent Lon protease